MVLAATAEAARAHTEDLVRDVTKKGFVVGEVSEPGTIEPFIGFRIARDGLISPPRQRVHLLYLAIFELVALPKVQVGDVAAIVGVITWVFLLRRPLLVVLSATYSFVQQPLHIVRPLWASVRKELVW